MTNIINNLGEGVAFNSPSFLIFISIFGGIIWILMSGSIAGHAAARDAQSGMHPLTYATPISKGQYIGARYLACVVINALIILMLPIGFRLGFLIRNLDPSLLLPYRAETFLTTYVFLSLPMVLVVTACQFSLALLNRRAIAAYAASIVLFPILSHFVGMSVAKLAGNWEVARTIDLVGIMVMSSMETWTPYELNHKLLSLEGTFLLNRFIWIAVGIIVLSVAYVRFGFTHQTPTVPPWKRHRTTSKIIDIAGAQAAHSSIGHRAAFNIRESLPTFGLSSQIRQTLAIAFSSLRFIFASKVGLGIIGLFALHIVIFAHEYLMFRGVPQHETTMNMLTLLTAPLRNVQTPLMIILVLIAYYAGELIWRDREAGLNTIADTMPVSEWLLFLGKFLGLAITIAVWLTVLIVAGILGQAFYGYTKFEIDVYAKAIIGFQLTNYVLFALLVLVIHVIVNQKYLAHLVVMIVYLAMVFSSKLGIEHNLLIYGSDPGWSYTDMRGFDPYIKPWLMFKIYWIGWAILLAVTARLFLVRNVSENIKSRARLARHRFNRGAAIASSVGLAIIVTAGGYIFYNTNILTTYRTEVDIAKRKVNYEKNYRMYKDLPQPVLTAVKVNVDLFPSQRKADVAGTYSLVNKTIRAIESIHVATAWGLRTETITFDRESTLAHEDNELGHRIYTLQEPLRPGDSLTMTFDVHYHAKGFAHKGIDASVIENGSYFINYEWLPLIGYQQTRELRESAERKKYGLGEWKFPSLYDTSAYQLSPGQELIDFKAIVSTEHDQIAVTAGKQKRTWTKDGRNYFEYASSAPMRNTYSFFSARYAVRESEWIESGKQVVIRFYYHPQHDEHIDRMLNSVQQSFAYYTAKFGPYPYDHITIMERSGFDGSLNAEATTIDYGESFTLSNLEDNPWALDIVFFAMSHEVAHQWWGASQLMPAHVEGAPVLAETLANYSALRVVEDTYGNDQVLKLLGMWRHSYEVPRSRVSEPLLRALDPFLGYRKGPLVLYSMTQYAGKDNINHALNMFMEKHGSGRPPFATTLDLYRELKAVIPDTLHSLLTDYFEKNIYWNVGADRADTKQIDSSTWEVTLQLHARKFTVDTTGAEIEVPMDEWVQVGVFAPWNEETKKEDVLYLQQHRIRSGKQTIKIRTSRRPGTAGVDPQYLLIDLNTDDNLERVKTEGEDEADFI
ncbi:MAG TPA: hypothetical protein VGD40_07405 [Chryseosolibacter sp.]